MKINPIRKKKLIIVPVKRKKFVFTPVKKKKKFKIDPVKQDTVVFISSLDPLCFYFDKSIQHFFLRYKNKDGTLSPRLNVWSVSFLRAVRECITKAEEMGIITHGYAIATDKEKEK